MGCSGGLEGGYGFDGDWRLRKKSEELRKFRLHLGNIVAKVFEDLLGRSRNVFRIRFEGGPEGGKVGEALFLGDSYHLGLDAVDLADRVGVSRLASCEWWSGRRCRFRSA